MFNIVMRDDKQYFYVGFTKEGFPKIFLTHRPLQATSHKLQASYIGPFTDGSALKATLRYLRGIFPYCTCKQRHDNYCLNYHIGKCLGFCCLKNQVVRSKEQVVRDYKKNIEIIKEILSGKKNLLLKKLEKEMVQSGENGDFEKAIELRNKISKLKRVFENAQIIENLKFSTTLKQLQKRLNIAGPLRRIEAYDTSNIQGCHATGSMVVFENGKPNKNEYRKFKISTCEVGETLTLQVRGDTDMLKEVLTRRFNHPEWQFPDLIIIDGGKGQLNTAIQVVSSKHQVVGPRIIALTKNIKHKGEKITLANGSINLSELPEGVKNLILSIDAEAHRFAISYYRKLHRKKIL